MSRSPLLIVGASGRAAAASAIRAGFDPFVIDLFADADTQRLCPVRKLPMAEYPHGFVALAAQLPPMPWMYTGGLENYPDVVAAISETRELWGSGRVVLKVVRDPFEIHHMLSAKGLEHPRVSRKATRDTRVRWIRKPFRSAAGFLIRFAIFDDDFDSTELEHFYFQEYLEGSAMSALVMSAGTTPVVLGVTRQFIGSPWLHAKPFQYAGNVIGGQGYEQIRDAVYHHAFQIHKHARTNGLWGFDFIWKDDRPYLLEVNPRYPASAELFEYACPQHGFAIGRRFFLDRAIGKGIYYSPHRIVFPPSGPWDESLANCTDVWRRPDFADLPHELDVIEAGHPVCTIFAEAATEEECVTRLMHRAAELDELFAVKSSP